jgi:hypothetical protein
VDSFVSYARARLAAAATGQQKREASFAQRMARAMWAQAKGAGAE